MKLKKGLYTLCLLAISLTIHAQNHNYKIHSSGSGFAIGNGYVATNYHVVDSSNVFLICGINGNINKCYYSEVVATDIINDVAILSITDEDFKGYGEVPYSIKNSTEPKASEVFALGYPLVTTMGAETKYNRGSINSLSGFKGNINNYQIDVPLQPGNSGGPLFNTDGELVGIVVAKHTNTENVNYAIKSPYLKILADSKGINLPTENSLNSLSRTQQVSLIEKYTYLILCGIGDIKNTNKLYDKLVFDEKETNDGILYSVNGVEFKMVIVQGGTFTMGDKTEEEPSYDVTLEDFLIGETEVTQVLWTTIMGNNPSAFPFGDNYPVESVSWNDCQDFINKLNSLTGKNFRLPTEAEWEYAARGGNKSKGYKYSGSNNVYDVAWFGYFNEQWRTAIDSSTYSVKQKYPNELGIYDMSGNVREWCDNKSDTLAILRNGGWGNSQWYCRFSYKDKYYPAFRSSSCGLRLALSLTQN